MLHAARALDDLRLPLGNRLEALRGDRSGQHSIRIDQQWRICFAWRGDGADEVPAEYHESMLQNLRVNREIMAAWRETSGDKERAADGPSGCESPTRASS